MKKYKAILFHPEGDYVSDFYDRENIQDVWSKIADMGSRWIFYPLPFVATEKTVVDCPEGLEFLKGKRIKTAVKFFKETWSKDAENISEVLNEGLPLHLAY